VNKGVCVQQLVIIFVEVFVFCMRSFVIDALGLLVLLWDSVDFFLRFLGFSFSLKSCIYVSIESDRKIATGSNVFFDESSDTFFTGTFESTCFRSIFEEDEGGHALNSNSLLDVQSLVNVEFGKGALASKFSTHCLVGRGDSDTRTAPGSESVNNADLVVL